MSLEFSTGILEAKKNILFVVIDELKKDKELDPEIVATQLIQRDLELKDLEKAIQLLKIASS